jgi:hypothetical protein
LLDSGTKNAGCVWVRSSQQDTSLTRAVNHVQAMVEKFPIVARAHNPQKA